jgi:hypothetical protein
MTGWMGRAVTSSWINCCRFALRSGAFGTGRTVRQFDKSYNGKGDLSISHCSGDDGEHLPRALPLPLGSDQHTRIEDQSHEGGESGS